MGKATELDREIFFKFYLTCFAAGLMHLTFLITFLCFGIKLMAGVNVVSVLLYITSGFVNLKKDLGRRSLRWLIAMYVEVILHAVLSTMILGITVWFYLYPITLMPIYAYYLFAHCPKKVFVSTASILGAITMVILAGTITYVEVFGTLYNASDFHQAAYLTFRVINIFFNMLIVIGFTLAFCIELFKMFDRLQDTNEQLNYIATHDALTGLSNRHSLWNFFENLEKSGDHYCIIMGDLDDFKKINDTYGHDCGDTVLKSVAGIILDGTGDTDMACRWGGEEMLIVLRGEREDCLSRITDIKSQISSLNITHEGKPVKVTMTFGFAGCEEREVLETEAEEVEDVASTIRPPAQLGIDSLISVVDKRLYTGKRSGKNVIVAA